MKITGLECLSHCEENERLNDLHLKFSLKTLTPVKCSSHGTIFDGAVKI